ncbi:MAG: ABC transporter ATP-binding protein [Gammaproteobacteria bacterium]
MKDDLLPALTLAWRASPSGLFRIVAITVVNGITPAIIVLLGKRFVDEVVSNGSPDLSTPALTLGLCLALLAAAQRTTTLLYAIETYEYSRLVTHEAQLKFLERASTSDLSNFDDPDWHDHCNRAVRDLAWRPIQLVQNFLGLLSSILTVLGMFGILASVHPILLVFAGASAVPSFVVQRRINAASYSFFISSTEAEREKTYIGEILTGLTSAKDIRAFQTSAYFLGHHDQRERDLMLTLHRHYYGLKWKCLFAGAVAAAALAPAYVFIAIQGQRGHLSAGALTAVLGATATVAWQSHLLSNSLTTLSHHASFLSHYFEFIRRSTSCIEPQELRIEEGAETRGQASKTGAISRRAPSTWSVTFRDVTFTYPGQDRPLLDSLTFHAESGKVTALVGKNGAGKTSIAKLLLRLYNVDSGVVAIGDDNIRDLDVRELRRNVGVMFEDFVGYEFDAKENVLLGHIHRRAGEEEVIAALDAAQALEPILRLPRGVESRLGRRFAAGCELSRGQWQRLVLARIMFRDSPIWVLDEPTSALDPVAEALIVRELRRRAAEGRTVIIITHRYPLGMLADHVAVVCDGRVVESGTHSELLKLGGHYAELWLQQFGHVETPDGPEGEHDGEPTAHRSI